MVSSRAVDNLECLYSISKRELPVEREKLNISPKQNTKKFWEGVESKANGGVSFSVAKENMDR